MKRKIDIYVDGSIQNITEKDDTKEKIGYAAVAIKSDYLKYEKVVTLNTEKSTDTEWIALCMGLEFAELLSRCDCECTVYSDLLYSVEVFNKPCEILEKIEKNIKIENYKNDSIYEVILEVLKYSNYSMMRQFEVKKIDRKNNLAHNLFSNKKNWYFMHDSLEIYDKELFKKYNKEVSKNMLEIELQRIEENCPYPWECSECIEGIRGDCLGLEIKNQMKII